MDIQRLKEFIELDDKYTPEERADLHKDAESVRGILEANFPDPFFDDNQRAAIAWFAAELLAGVTSMTVAKVGDMVSAAALAYGTASGQLMNLVPLD